MTIDYRPIGRSLLIALLVLLALPTMGQERHSEVRIVVSDRQAAAHAARVAEMDHFEVERTPAGWEVVGVIGARARELLREARITFEVLDADVVTRIQQRATTCPPETPPGTPQGFFYGSLNCHPNLDEAVAALAHMRAAFPELITEKVSIGQSWEGREIWVVRISAAEDPETVPEALYTSLHHAREPGSLASLLYFMYYLLENYGLDDEVTYVLENRALYFIPVVNPDGYAFVETDDIMWRKNRRPNDSGTFGVDLNRNYAYHWDCDWGATSCNPASNVYAGPFPFSEPETQAIRDWLSTRAIRGAFNYHTFGGYWLHPWGNTVSTAASQTSDHDHFTRLGAEITRQNAYRYGPGGVVLYPVAGGSDDWMYGEQEEKDKILAFTPEMGTSIDQFWPAPSRIVPIARDALHANLVLAHFVGEYITEARALIVGDGTASAGADLRLTTRLRNLGLSDARDLRARIVSENADLGPPSGTWSEAFDVPANAQAVSPELTYPVSPTLEPGEYEGLFVEIDIGHRLITVAVEPIQVGGAVAFGLEAPYPNPSRGEVEIRFGLEHDDEVTLIVYDRLGRSVRNLGDGSFNAGPNHVTWDGRDAAGRPVASGTYVVELRTQDAQAVRRLVIVR